MLTIYGGDFNKMKNIKQKNNFLFRLVCLLCVLLLFSVGVTGCSTNRENTTESMPKDETEKNSQPLIAVTIIPEETFVKAVCGDLADVIVAIPKGSNPENYEPKPKEREKIEKASLYFAIGVPTEESNILPYLEDYSNQTGSDSSTPKMKIVYLQEEVSKKYEDLTFEQGGRDPHIWLSPKRAQVMTEVIAREMCLLDPENSEIYKENATNYIQTLDSLDKELQTLSSNSKVSDFIVYHPAFGYVANDYGLKMHSLENNGKEATAKHLIDMVDFAKEKNISVIFYQEEIDSKQAEAFADELDGEAIMLSPLSADYENNLYQMMKKITHNQ